MPKPETRRTVFVGGPRHGRTIGGQPAADERYRVPAIHGADAVDYKAVAVNMMIPNPVTGEAQETWTVYAYASAQVDPETTEGQEAFARAFPDALMRAYVTGNGSVRHGDAPTPSIRYIARCNVETCPMGGMDHPYDTPADRARVMTEHSQQTGHTMAWRNEGN